MINNIQNYSLTSFAGRRLVKNKSNLAKNCLETISKPENTKPEIEENPVIKAIKDACKALVGKIGKEKNPRVPVDIHPDGAGDVFLSVTKPVTIDGPSRKNVIKVSVHGPDGVSSSGAFSYLKDKGSLGRIKKALKNPNTPKEVDKAVKSLTEGLQEASSSEAKDIRI